MTVHLYFVGSGVIRNYAQAVKREAFLTRCGFTGLGCTGRPRVPSLRFFHPNP